VCLNEQHGFRSNFSTENVLCKLINEILLALNNKVTIGGIFCDFERAFLCVSHNTLWSELEFCGIIGKFNILIKSYL
jgi:hypothetical protein